MIVRVTVDSMSDSLSNGEYELSLHDAFAMLERVSEANVEHTGATLEIDGNVQYYVSYDGFGADGLQVVPHEYYELNVRANVERRQAREERARQNRHGKR